MLSTEIVIKKLSPVATASESIYNYFASHLNEKLPVRSVDFVDSKYYAKHGIFAVTIDRGKTVSTLFTYHGDSIVEFELYIGGNKVWPKQ